MRFFFVGLGLIAVLAACQDLDQCKDPGRVEACLCGESETSGARTCLPEQVWSACDCSVDAGALIDGGTGGMSGGTGGMSGGTGGMSGGTGGMSGGMGGMSGGMGGMGGMSGGMGGAGGDSGVVPQPDASVDSSAPVEPGAYAACTVDTVADDCLADSTCVESDAPLFGGSSSFVCAPACTMAETCPAPEGTGFEGMIDCVSGRCRLTCASDILQPVACPTGMTCAAEGSSEFCFAM